MNVFPDPGLADVTAITLAESWPEGPPDVSKNSRLVRAEGFVDAVAVLVLDHDFLLLYFPFLLVEAVEPACFLEGHGNLAEERDCERGEVFLATYLCVEHFADDDDHEWNHDADYGGDEEYHAFLG